MSYEKFKYTEALNATMLMEAITNMSLEDKSAFVHTVLDSNQETEENFRVVIHAQAQINVELATLLKQSREEALHLRSLLHQ